MSSPETLAIPPNQAVIAAGVEPDGTRSGIALDSESRIIVSPSSGAPLPADASTHSAQTDGTQRTGVLGADGTTLASNANPVPISDAGGSLTVDGTVTANNANLDVALSTLATQTTVASMLTALSNILTQLTPPTTRTNPTPITLTTAGTQYPLASASAKSVTIRNTSGSGYIYVGGSLVSSSNAAIKLAIDESYSTICTNANQVYVTGSTDAMTAAYEVLS